MGKKYVYMHHQGFDFYFTDHEKTQEECHCSYCEEYDELIGVYEDEETFAAKLKELFSKGYDVLPGDDYNEIKDKYCPLEFRLWEQDDEMINKVFERVKRYGVANDITGWCYGRAKEIYGERLPDKIRERLEWELSVIRKQGSEIYFAVPMYLAGLVRGKGGMVGVRACAAASFVAYLLGITDINPLEAHYRCDKCNYCEFPDEGSYYTGIDLPERKCPVCGEEMRKDGFFLRPEMFFGIDGDKMPDIDLLISSEAHMKIMEQVRGVGVEYGEVTDDAIYLKSGRSQENTSAENMIKFDLLPNTHLELLVQLRDKTGIDIMDIPLNDEQVMSAIRKADTMGNAEYGSAFAREIIGLSKPVNLSDLIRVSGILHGSGVWEHNAEELLQNDQATLKEIISLRDDIYELLLQSSVEKKLAYKIMEFVRKGMFYVGEGMKETSKRAEMRSQYSEILGAVNVPAWYIEALKKVCYAFPKAHTAEWARRYYHFLWYQKHFPETYSQLCGDMDGE